MEKPGSPELALVDGNRRLCGRGGDLRRNRQHGIYVVFAGDVKVSSHLLSPQPVPAGLYLDQAAPGCLAAATDNRPIRDRGLAFAIFETDLGECLDHRRPWGTQLLQ